MASRSSFLPLAIPTMLLLTLASCADEDPTEPPQTVEHTLTVIVEPGVSVSPEPGDHTVAEGETVSYTATAADGYGFLTVTLDGEAVAASGEFVMDTARLLLVSADPVPAPLPMAEPVVQAAEDLLTSADPAGDYQAMLDALADLQRRVGPDSTAALMSAVNRSVFDWATRGPEIRALSEALDGQVYEYAPDHEGGTAAVGLQLASSASVAVEDTLSRALFLHVNGVLTGPGEALEAMVDMAGIVGAAGLPVHAYGESSWDENGRILYRHVYNHSLNVAISDCMMKLITAVRERGTWYYLSLLSMSPEDRAERLGCDMQGSTATDFSEALTQVVEILLDDLLRGWDDGLRPPPVAVLAAQATTYRDRGYNVIFTAHSQGNLMVIQALNELADLPRDAPSSCVGYIGIAPPIYTNYEYAETAGAFIAGAGNAVDFLTMLPAALPQAEVQWTEKAQALDDDWPRFLAFRRIAPIYAITTGIELHSLAESYLNRESSETSWRWVRNELLAQYQSLAQTCGGYVSGRVLHGGTNEPIAGAEVELLGATFRTSSVEPTIVATTDAEGRFTTSLLPARASDLKVVADGYVVAEVLAVEPAPFDTVQINDVPLAAASNLTGSIFGQITDSRWATAVAGASVELRTGANAGAGDLVASTQSDASGYYTLTDLEAGTYSLVVSADDYVTESVNVSVVGGENQTGVDVDLAPTGSDIVITLNWGETPSDLDAHLEGPTESGGSFHVAYYNLGSYTSSPWAGLDRDDTNSYGPETITITRLVEGSDYVYWVHDYSNRDNTSSTALGNSGANVTVSRHGRVIQTFTVPAGIGNRWTVFRISGGELVEVNRLEGTTSWSAAIEGGAAWIK